MGDYRKLKIYEKSYRAAVSSYRMTEKFPEEEKYGMTSQIRRASMSIALNIAEGNAKRESKSEFKRFLMMALGSANEMRVLIDFAKEFGYIDEETHRKASNEYEGLGKMIRVFIEKLAEQKPNT